jgi:dCMP deaminase
MVKSDEYYFNRAKRLTETKSTCLKIKTAAVIVKNGRIIGRGYNLCSPEGFNHGKPVGSCLRMTTPTGTGYELCKGVHAEVLAIADSGAKNCKGAILYLSGHFYPCWHCESLARIVGVKEIKVKDIGAKKFYGGTD